MDIPIVLAIIVFTSIFLLVSLSYVMTSKTLGAPNYSVGALMAVGFFVTGTVGRLLRYPAYFGLPVSSLLGAAIYYLFYRFVVRRIQHNELDLARRFLVTIGINFVISSLVRIYVYVLRDQSKIYPMWGLMKEYDFNIGFIKGSALVSTTLVIALFLFLRMSRKTRYGLYLRLSLSDYPLAQIQGMNVNLFSKITWIIAGGLTCLAGSLWPFYFMWLDIEGTIIMISVFAAILLGGMDNVQGVFVGATLVGLIELGGTILGQVYFGVWFGEYRPFIPILLIISVLLIKSYFLKNGGPGRT